LQEKQRSAGLVAALDRVNQPEHSSPKKSGNQKVIEEEEKEEKENSLLSVSAQLHESSETRARLAKELRGLPSSFWLLASHIATTFKKTKKQRKKQRNKETNKETKKERRKEGRKEGKERKGKEKKSFQLMDFFQ